MMAVSDFSFWHLNVLAEVFEYNELSGMLGWREPEAKWPGRGALGRSFHISGPQFPLLQQVNP